MTRTSDTITAHVRLPGGQTRTLTLPVPEPAWKIRQAKPATIAEIDKLLGHAAWKTASKDGGEVRSAVADQELNVLEPLTGAEGEIAGLLHGPLAGGVRGNATEVHPAGAVFDER